MSAVAQASVDAASTTTTKIIMTSVTTTAADKISLTPSLVHAPSTAAAAATAAAPYTHGESDAMTAANDKSVGVAPITKEEAAASSSPFFTCGPGSLTGKVIVFIRLGGTARVKPYRHLKSLGATLIMVNPVINHPLFDGIFDLWVQCEVTNVDLIEETLAAALVANGFSADAPDAIISCDEYGIFPAATLAVRKSLRPIPLRPEHIKATNAKAEFRTFCQLHGIRSPKSHAFSYTDNSNNNHEDGSSSGDVRNDNNNASNTSSHYVEARTALGITYPVVLKPSPGAGSLLSMMVYDDASLEAECTAMWKTLHNYGDKKHFDALGVQQQILMEEYIGGQEVDIDCVIENGVVRFGALADDFDTTPPYFQEAGGLNPSALSPAQGEQVWALLRQFLAAYGTQVHGVLHFEAKFDFDRNAAYIIEVNLRMGGAEVDTMVRSSFKVPMIECLGRLALGLPLPDHLVGDGTPTGIHASVNIYAETEGHLLSAAMPTDDPDFVDGMITMNPGDYVAPAPKQFCLLCWMVARGTTSEEATANIKRLTSKFTYAVKPM